MRIFRNIFSRLIAPLSAGFKDFTDKLVKHLELSSTALKILEECVYYALSESEEDKAMLLEKITKIKALEYEGDELVRQVNDSVLKGAVPLMSALLMGSILTKSEYVLDNIHVMAKELKRLCLKCATPALRKFAQEDYLSLLRISREAICMLIELVKNAGFKSIDELTVTVSGIQKLEEEADRIKESVLDFLYAEASVRHLTYLEFIGATHLIFTADNVIDALRDIAYMMLTLVGTYGV